MTFAVKTPLSFVRSTINEIPSIHKRRRRPTFSLHLDINITHSFCATSSQSTTPALSPSWPCIPTLSPVDTLPPSPVTPADTSRWPNGDARDSTETPTFNFVAWTNRDTLYFAAPDSPSSRAEHASAHISIRSGNKDDDVPFGHRQPSSTLHLLQQANPGGKSSILSVPQEEVNVKRRMSRAVESDDSSRVAPRQLRPRSRPRDGFELDHIAPPELAGTSQFNLNLRPQFAVSANYRLLSAREMKELNLGPHRRHYKCLMDGCDRLFSRKSNAENHIRAHLDDKPFVCSLSTCKSAFVRKGDLLRHEEIHRPSRVHTCSWCVFSSSL